MDWSSAWSHPTPGAQGRAPPWEPEHETLTAQFWVELRASPAMLLQAADEWDDELLAFPERP